MQTKVGRGKEFIEECAALIRSGEIVAFPTETVYGLGGDATDARAVEKIYEAKNRPSDNPFIVHVADVEDVEKAAFLTEEAKKIFGAFSPGPITVVLKKKPCIPDCVTAGLDTVGIRIPSHPVAREFLRACGTPVAAPSANLSKKVSPTTAARVLEDMDGRIPAIIDGGACDVGIESTVLSLAGDPVILRPGAVTEEMLRPYLPRVKNFAGKIKIAPSPGMKYTHYCPTVPCVLFSSPESATEEYERQKAYDPIVLATEKTCDVLRAKGVRCASLGRTGEEVARNVFESLRTYEKTNGYLIVEALRGDGIEYGVMNRLLKSSKGVIV